MRADDVDQVREAFTDRLGREPDGLWAAPGRVNLIGEHTDYNDGYVMPFALEQCVTVAAAARPDATWTVQSLTTGETRTLDRADLRPGMEGWAAYPAGVVWALLEAGHDVPGADLTLTSDVPSGAGLSSSAALECSVLTALVDLGGLSVAPLERAKLARRCENEFVGAPTGLMDQAASTMCTADHALFLDCRTFDVRQVPLPPGDLEVLVVDTNTPHALVDSEYAARRRTCEEAARVLGVPALRDVEDLDAALAKLDDEAARRRVRHVVTENARVREAADLLGAGSLADLGPLLSASHASMRDDFEITVDTVDAAAETAERAGALGARMTGGGFGGCVLALVPAGGSATVAAAVERAFADRGFRPPSWFVARPSPGARRIA